jgi:hypothetical protein
VEVGGSQPEVSPGKVSARSSAKNKLKAKQAGNVAHVAEHLPSQAKILRLKAQYWNMT